ncbi:MAG: nucleotidyl transferase AbiEii/AbiGii toxin family protein [Acidobacteria bacterium]|nr:nucleotidyl transferase AbiEii/AbiGii toxin family protein [Acidobacteriota bacterium]
MTSAIIQSRLQRYDLVAPEDEWYALKEILQEIVLQALAEARFFDVGIFHGGTALRVFHGLPRFSEDLDFVLRSPDPGFAWSPYGQAVADTCRMYGIVPEFQERGAGTGNVRALWVKDTSLGRLLELRFSQDPRRNIVIRLEIDIDPPPGAADTLHFHDFPVTFSAAVMDLPSHFAGKCHALLCREYVKGRDWYDLLWFIRAGCRVNLPLLAAALHQTGPWADERLELTPAWLIHALGQKIATIDWPHTARDVAPFLPPAERQGLAYWSRALFMDRLGKLERILMSPPAGD